MSAYLYAIVEGLPPRWRPPAGVGGGAIEARAVGGFTVLAAAVDPVPDANPKTLALHHDVVASALEAASLVPLRYGVVLPEPELGPWLAAQASLLGASLVRLRGRVEMSVKLLRLGGAVEPPRGGRAPRGAAATSAPGDRELRGLAEHLVERAGLADWCYRPAGTAGNVVASLAFLVERAGVSDFLARIAPVAARATGVAVVPTGPWPAYSFAPPLARRPLAAAAEPLEPPGERRAG